MRGIFNLVHEKNTWLHHESNFQHGHWEELEVVTDERSLSEYFYKWQTENYSKWLSWTHLTTCDHLMICLNDLGHTDEFSTWFLKGMVNSVSQRNFEVIIERNFQLSICEGFWNGHWEEFSTWFLKGIFNLVSEKNFELVIESSNFQLGHRENCWGGQLTTSKLIFVSTSKFISVTKLKLTLWVQNKISFQFPVTTSKFLSVITLNSS